MIVIRYLIRTLLVLLLAAFASAAAFSAPGNWQQVSYLNAAKQEVVPACNLTFNAGTPALTRANVATTGAPVCWNGDVPALLRLTSLGDVSAFLPFSIATNRGVSAPNLTERGTFTNRYPSDAAVLQSTPRTLVQDSSGRYWLEGPGGNRITPSGSYDFVTMPNGTVRVARPNTNQDYSTHLGLSSGGEVSYAGSIRFGNNAGPSRGTITNWTNNSGHYTPPADLSGNAGLPSGSFTAHQ